MSDHLGAEQIARVRALLLDEHQRLRARGWEDEPATSRGDIQDLAAREAGARDERNALSHGLRRLADVEAALARIDGGTYGICEASGDPIPFARLLLEPTARYTVEAQAEVEDELRRQRSEDDEQPY